MNSRAMARFWKLYGELPREPLIFTGGQMFGDQADS
jgi:hypothetical protein